MNLREKFIVLVDNDYIKKSDAIILLEGDGLYRCKKAIDLYKSGLANKIVFTGGIINKQYGSFPFCEAEPIFISEGIPMESVILEEKSQNTREQAVEVIKLAQANGWRKLILVGSHYHQYRAYLTFLREILDVNRDIILYNSPANDLEWFSETGWGTRITLLEQEFDRIEKYTAFGHLATFDEAILYQQWKEKQV